MSEFYYAHILSEDDNDDVFYQACLSKITGNTYEAISRKLRKGGGISAVRRALPLMLQDIQRTGMLTDTCFIVALDNDRSPIHPEHARPADFSKLPKADQKKSCRYCDLEKIVIDRLGSTRSEWPIQGAIAVPVQMLETWLLLISNPGRFKSEASLPLFAERSQSSTRTYYQSNPPPQLKDLKKDEKKRLGMGSDREFCQYCAEQLSPEALAKLSPSFQRFLAEVLAWKIV